ncbi:hypothetical protein V6N13_123683 [Hibiscus sabdariffa]
MRVLSWNVRGLGSSVKRMAIRKVLQQQSVEMVFLMETKLEQISDELVKGIWWTDSFSFIASPSTGLSGGILVIWELGRFDICESRIDRNFILLSGDWRIESWKCDMVVIYAPCEVNAQLDLWRCLGEMVSAITAPVCCGGDFNVVLSLEERRNCVGDKRGMDGFVSFVEEMGFLNLPAAGKAFSWLGTGLKASRLDLFLVSPAWVEKFYGLEQFILQRGISDHAPVRLTSGYVDWGPKLFRFLNCWLEKRGHVKIIEKEWFRFGEESDSALLILDKLRLMKSFLKVWNKRDESVEDSNKLVESRRELQGNLWRLLQYRASIWRQKSWILWLREGDRNTHFFQQVEKIRGSFEPVVSLASLSEELRNSLERPFTEDEPNRIAPTRLEKSQLGQPNPRELTPSQQLGFLDPPDDGDKSQQERWNIQRRWLPNHPSNISNDQLRWLTHGDRRKQTTEQGGARRRN